MGIIGLGYVGLPLAVEFGKHFETVGFDLKASRIAELQAGRDSTLEVTKAELASSQRLSFTDGNSPPPSCSSSTRCWPSLSRLNAS